MLKTLKKIGNFFKSHLRYLLVLLIFVVVLLTGKNLVPKLPDANLTSQIAALSKQAQGIYEIGVADQAVEIDNFSQLKEGDAVRILFDLKTNDDGLSQPDLSRKGAPAHYQIDVSLKSKSGKKKFLQTLDTTGDDDQRSLEILTVADDRYSTLLFEKKDIESKELISIDNLRVSRLNTANLSRLKATVSGKTATDKVVLGNISNNPGKGYRFTEKNQSIGQVFTATTEMMSGINLKIETIGSGGLGSFFLELREVDESQGNIQLSSNRLAYYNFTPSDLNQIQYAQGSYHFPLGAKLKKGKKYFIGLNNESATVNFLNNLRLLDTGSEKQFDGYGLSSSGNESTKLNNIFFSLFGADYSSFNGVPVLTGANIEDLGQGIGSYHYRSNKGPTDFLDIASVSATVNPVIAYYDNVQQGISGMSQNGTEFTYKFDTIYPFTQMDISLNRYGGQTIVPLVFYSFDNQNWHQFDQLTAHGSANQKALHLDQVIRGDGSQNTIYIRTTYDSSSADSLIDLFGIGNILVNAELAIK